MAGVQHPLALKSDGGVWAWGDNADGELGLGDTTPRTLPVAVPPVIGSLTSSTHPEQTSYYSNNAPTFSWMASDVTAAGYSYVLDQTPDTVPDTTIDTTATSASFTGLADGVWYFHLRVCNEAAAWSAPTTYTICIDTTPPTTEDNTDGLWHRCFTLELTPSDTAAGVMDTQYRVDGGPWQSGTECLLRTRLKRHPDRGGLTNGSHTVDYFSTDEAGNNEKIVSCTVLLDQPGAASPSTMLLLTRRPAM